MTKGTGNQEYGARWQGALTNNYGTPAVALVRGEGAQVWDADGSSTPTSSAASRSTPSGTPTRRSSRP